MRIGVIGLGLIGGSIAKAWHAAGHEVYGYDVDAASIGLAVEEKVIQPLTEWRQWTPLVEQIVLATPLAGVVPWIEALTAVQRHQPGWLIDVSSVKTGVVQTLANVSPPWAGLSLHPMAGREHRGYRASDAQLFQGFVCAVIDDRVTKLPQTLINQWMAVLGCRPVVVSPDDHDKMVAAVSHLPYLVSAALLSAIGREPEQVLSLAGSGFRDTTRVGASDPQLWEEIVLANVNPVRQVLSQYLTVLEQCQEDLEHGRFPDILRQAPLVRQAISF